MTTYDDLAQAAAALADPTTTSRDLMAIAQAYPSLWADVAGHPNAYPDLLSWLNTVGDDTVREAIAVRGPSPEISSPPPPPPPADGTEVEEGSPVPESGNPAEDSEPASLDAANSTDLNATTSDAESSIDFHAPETPEDSSPTTPMDTVPENPTRAVESSPAKPSWISTSKGKKILIGFLAVILAVVLIITLVVIPHQRAEEAAAAEQARLDQEHQAAVDAFTKAVDGCTQANKSLTDSITHAQQTALTDPSTLDDPSLIDSLNQAIATAQSVKTCVPPTMADDTGTIQEQTTQIATDTDSVATSVSTLTKADQSVTTSVQTKKDKEAAAAEQAKKAANFADFTITTKDGYTYHFQLSGNVTASIDPTQGKPGNVQMKLDISSSTITVTNTTPNKVAPSLPWFGNMWVFPIYMDNPCQNTDAATNNGCGSFDMNGKTYWLVGGFGDFTLDSATGELGVGQSIQMWPPRNMPPGIPKYRVTLETPSPNGEALQQQISVPTGWLVTVVNDPTASSHYTGWTVKISNGLPVLGCSASIDCR